ncbi:MAG: hypothetical protein ACK4SY_07350 [Pyrobaculum sp.]
MSYYISALLYYIYKKKFEKGLLVAIRTREICGTDKRCSWYLREVMLYIEGRGLARRYKRGVYLIERKALDRVIATVRDIK